MARARSAQQDVHLLVLIRRIRNPKGVLGGRQRALRHPFVQETQYDVLMVPTSGLVRRTQSGAGT
jgi:hypothetical protein